MNWTIVIAVLSLFVSLSGVAGPPLFQHFFRRAKLLIHNAGMIQLTFGPFGPGVSLIGSIQALHRPLFVTSVEILVVHQRSKEEHRMVWRLLFPDVFQTEPGTNVKRDIPTGVMVNPQQAYRFNAFFAESTVENYIVRPVADRVRRDWIALMTNTLQNFPDKSPETIAQLISDAKQVQKTLFLEFMKTETFQWSVENLESTCFWKEGAYLLTLCVHASETKNAFTRHWRFELDETCVRNLKANAEFAIAELAGLTDLPWLGCTVDYLDGDN